MLWNFIDKTTYVNLLFLEQRSSSQYHALIRIQASLHLLLQTKDLFSHSACHNKEVSPYSSVNPNSHLKSIRENGNKKTKQKQYKKDPKKCDYKRDNIVSKT